MNAETKERIYDPRLARMGANALVTFSLFLGWIPFERGKFCLFLGKQLKYRLASRFISLLHQQPAKMLDVETCYRFWHGLPYHPSSL